MKLLINTSTLSGTGVTQVSVSFLQQCKLHPENEYVVFLSPNVSNNIDKTAFPHNFTFYEFGQRTLYLPYGWKDLCKMRQIERRMKPDCVFSVFGPSWWTPQAPHLMGYAYPHYVYPDSPIFNIITKKEKIQIAIMKAIHKFFFKKNGEYYVCETEDVKSRLSKFFKIEHDKIYVVFNTANSYFLNANTTRVSPVERTENSFYFYSLCSPYQHKNLYILNKVIPLLLSKLPNKKIFFYTTIPEASYNEIFIDEVKPYILNQGPLKVSDCPSLVMKADALFLPTLLECFSASYPEAMCLSKPILTSNLSFAKSICGDAALYFDPLNPYDIVDKIETLLTTSELQERLICKGKQRLKDFGTPESRASEYLSICASISKYLNSND